MATIDPSRFRSTLLSIVRYGFGRTMEQATKVDIFNSVCFAVREHIIDRKIETEKRYADNDVKRMHYISMEFLTGPLLANNLINLGIYDECRTIVNDIGLDFDDLIEFEPDPALGNGGLGRLAACFLDSLASMGMPGFGYGINYDYGLFHQSIIGGYQHERPDFWYNKSSPWLMRMSGEKAMVPVFGRIEDSEDMVGEYNPMWVEWKLIVGRPHDIAVVGYGGKTVNRLRLFSAWASEDFDIQIFNEGDYYRALEDKIRFENISKILYPSDSRDSGKELRLVQEYFLVACAVHDIVSIYLNQHDSFDMFHEKVAIQLNDTHPALTVAELMRVLIDLHFVEWDDAWQITTRTLGYTNHTLMPEALETWPMHIFKKVIPRHLQIIQEIDRRFMSMIKEKYPDDPEKPRRMSIVIDNNGEKNIRMAHLAIVGSHSVNGVAAIHSELVKTRLVPDFYDLWPEKFNNKTNGVTPRRWILRANPLLAQLVCDTIGDGWILDLGRLRELEAHCKETAFLERLLMIKRKNKVRLASIIKETTYIEVDPESIFDIHAKRLHEYKRQLLNAMNIIHIYFQIRDDNIIPSVPRTFIFGGKAAPGYFMAKLVIRFIHGLAEIINKDSKANEWLKVVFIPDYRVSLAEKMIPGADVSEQISTAGMEASGTGNMKFAMNGAITIGTLDGANIEIAGEVGEENIYIFGHKVDEIESLRREHDADRFLNSSPALKRVMDAVRSDIFCPDEPGIFKPLYDSIVHGGDYYCHMADFQSYTDAHSRLANDYMDRHNWAVKSLLNIARTGKFSSDRTIKEYAEEIWKIKSQI
ncbi:Glycogen phosphorylase [Desulfamplus magnetovallimortis]|uniref:Alpha-1,4 glucan phosphorylase n=1 Tax=Desulfamplus magnetovallimortis TaxID=1246637 RepID=A0A1W1HKX1_9BACT|nr:glycogen/starch/alpha-glucan phosphorylase [Desulfamplus magnetovallimortis]SLM32998.1 Glycogen phosphorylase [Desulfamplus magnetovallimortis]